LAEVPIAASLGRIRILIDEIAAWEHDRNANHTKADWQFTTKNVASNLSICTLQSD